MAWNRRSFTSVSPFGSGLIAAVRLILRIIENRRQIAVCCDRSNSTGPTQPKYSIQIPARQGIREQCTRTRRHFRSAALLRFFDRNTDSGNAKSACVPEVSANEKKSTDIPEAARPVGRSQVIVCSITRERLPRPSLPRADTAIPGIRKMVRLRDRPCSTQKDVANSRKEMACAEYFASAAR